MKKFLSILLAVMMVVTILPVNLMAAPIESEHSHEHAAEAAEPQADAEPLAEGTIITINQIDYTIEGKENVVISGTVKTAGGTPITSGTLEAFVDGTAIQNQPVLQSDGSFSASVSGVRSGSHKATVKYSGGGAYSDAEAEQDFYVNPKEFFIRIDSNGYSMDDNVFKGTVRMSYPEDDGSSTVYYGVGFGMMIPSFRGISLTAIPSAGYSFAGWYRNDENGDLLTDKEEWGIGSNSIYAAYTHYAKFVKDDSKTTYAVTFVDGLERMSIHGFTITKTSGTVLPDDLSAPNYLVEPGWGVSFSIEASEGYIKTEDYKVLCNGAELTAVDGVYTVSNINGNKEIRVNGIVDKTAPVVTINDIPSVMYGEKVVVSGTVIDIDGKPVTEGTVQVYVDNIAGWPAVKLAADGSFTCEISGIEAGEHIATARYFAEKTYVDASANKNFTVLAGHTHCICGGKSENHASHSAVTYTAWDGGEITYEKGAAYLYIPADTTVTLQNDITIGSNQTLYLCLNEKSSILASSGSAHIIINGTGARLVICSCRSEQGTFKGRTDGAGNGGCIELIKGTLDIYGGNIGYANAEKGGAIYAYSYRQNESVMNIYGGSICSSTAVNGGGLYMAHSEANGEFVPMVYMHGGAIENNKATENGGGVYIEGDKSEWFGIRMSGGAIRKNNAAGNGGGIYSYFGRNIFITDGEISENTAANGGGIYLNRYSPSRIHGLLEMSGGKVTGNTATQNGGGIYATHVEFGSSSTGAIGFRNVEISGNNAKNGGGIYAETGCYGNIRDSIIENNKAARTGGGIYITDNFWSTLFIRGTTRVINNNAYTAGGIAVIDAGKVEINDSALIKDNTTINLNDVSQILVDGNDGKNASTVIMNGGTIDSYEVESGYGIQLKNGAAFTVNGGYMDIYGAYVGIDNADGTFTVNGGVVEVEAEWDRTEKKSAYYAKPEVKDTMFARHGDLKETAHDVALSKVDWKSRYIYLGTGYSVEIRYYNLEDGVLPEDAPKKHVYGTTTVLPIPTRDGYIFDGWYENSALTLGPVTEIGADITGTGDLSFRFYAKWTKISEWNEPTYVWTKTATGYECTATRTHKTDASKVETETVTAAYNEVSAATCDSDGYGTYLATFTNEAFKEQIKTVTLPKGHIWETPRYNWTPDALGGYKCTATRMCHRNWDHVETETVVATLIEGTSATCTEDGHGKYNAVFTNPAFAEQTKEFDTPAIGHAWNEPTYNWTQTANGYNCTAKRVCANFASHVETETVTAAYAEITPATEEADGLGRYTATFTNEAFAEQTKDVTLPKIVHDWDVVTIWWEGEYCIASRTCKAHGEVESEKVKGVYSVEIEPGCTTAGRGKYVAYFTNPVFTAVTAIYGSPTKTKTLPALGHDWDTPSFSWREEQGDYICDAVHYCKRNEAHFEASSTHATYEVITKPTCEADGLGRYTAVFALADFETQTKDVVLKATGHDWDVTTYEWTKDGDGYTVTAKHICKTDASHVETETVTAVYAVVTPATCLKDGLGRFTATFTAAWAETQTKDLTLKAFGHNWSEVTYTWTEENGVYKVRAYRECQNAGCDYIGVDQVTAEYAVVTPATCTEDGVGRYTAEFHYDWAETQTKDVVLNATGHDWNATTYEWTKTNGGYTVTAKHICKNDATHIETETVTAVYAVVTPATCLKDGLGRFTAEFKADWANTQTKDVVLKATGHDWDAATYEWTKTNGGYTVTAKRICKNDSKHIETETATATYAVITAETCVKEGLGRFTAEFKAEWANTQTKDEVRPAMGHDWDAATYEWTKTNGGYTVTAKRVCKNDATHIETETVTATYAVITAETCVKEGLGRFTAEFKADWANTQTKDIAIPANGHDHSSYWRYNEFEHWRICPVCKDIIDVQAHDLTDWKTILDNRGKDTDREERHCRICAYEQFSTTIHIGGKNGTTEETNPNTGAEVFIRLARAAAADNRVNEKA